MTLLRRTLTLACPVFLLSALMFAVLAPVAFAHSELVESVPADGDQLEVMPRSATLVFNEDIDPNFVQAVVADASGVARPVEPAVAGAEMVVQIPPDVASGEVEVRYRIVSADGHPVGGAISFTVPGAASAATAPAQTPAQAAPPADGTASEPASSTTWMYVLTALAAALVVIVALAITAVVRRRR